MSSVNMLVCSYILQNPQQLGNTQHYTIHHKPYRQHDRRHTPELTEKAFFFTKSPAVVSDIANLVVFARA